MISGFSPHCSPTQQVVEDQRIDLGLNYNSHPAPPENALTRKIYGIIKIRYTCTYLSNRRAKDLEYKISSKKRVMCMKRDQK